MWAFGIVWQFAPLALATRIAIWFVAALGATHLARRVLAIEVGTAAVAAAAGIAIVVGLFASHYGQPIELLTLLPVGASFLGALLGARISRPQADDAAVIWLLLAVGFVCYGGTAIGSFAPSVLGDSSYGLAFAGTAIAAFVVAWTIDVNGTRCAAGCGIVVGILELANSVIGSSDFEPESVFSLVLFAALGGWVGARVRESRKPKLELPTAHVR